MKSSKGAWVTAAALAMFPLGCALTGTSGEPALRLALDNGATRSFFVQSMYDMQTLAVDTDANGRVMQQVHVLTDDRLRSIEKGMDGNDLLKAIGPPYRRVAFERLGTVAWDYRYRDTWGYIVEFSALVDAGNKVTGKFTRRLEVDRDDR